VQLLTSIGVPPSLATFSQLDVLMNAAIIAVSLLGWMAFPRMGCRTWPAYRFVAAVLIETARVCCRLGWRPWTTWSRTRPGCSWVPCCSSRSALCFDTVESGRDVPLSGRGQA
jgi:hypothetical protein